MLAWVAILATTGALAVPTTARPSHFADARLARRAVAERALSGDCPARIIQQLSNPYCKQQCGTNFVPQYDGSCACKAPFQQDGTYCSPVCTNGFSLSDDKATCVCAMRKFTSSDGTTCSNNCPSGQYGDANHLCTPCPANVKTCKDASTALTCNSGYFLYNGACVAQCPVKTYADSTNVCRPCADSDASSCTDGGANSATACMTKYLFDGQCLAGDSLPGGFYGDPITHTVKQCAPGVKSCTCGDANCATACGEDSNNNQLYLNFDGTCVSQCASGSYNDPHTDACLKCDSTALTCDANGALTCGKDSVGNQLYLTPTKKCILAAAGVVGYYPDSATNTFKPCLDGVTSCVGSGTYDALTCGIRSDGTTLYFTGRNPGKRSIRIERRFTSSTGACVEAASCPTATWADAIANTCTNCDANETACKGNGEGQALACASGTYLSTSGDCLTATQCGSSGAFWPDSTHNVCSNCDAGEAACTGNGPGLATACAKNSDGQQLYLYKGDCYTPDACPAAYYPDANSDTCKPCDAGALTCTGHHAALTCGTDSAGKRLYLNIDGMCVQPENCAGTTYADPATRKCESCKLIDPNAATCSGLSILTCSSGYLYQGACVPSCPNGFFSNASKVCTPCADPAALTCDASGAFTCQANYLLYKGGCTVVCPVQTYRSGNTCVDCVDPLAATCDASVSLSCLSGYLYQGTCYSQCPSGTYASGFTCTSCADRWGEGTVTCDSTGATLCDDNYVFGILNSAQTNRCISTDVCATTYHGYDNNGRCRICGADFAYAITCTASGPTTCVPPFNVISGACGLCPDGIYEGNYFSTGFWYSNGACVHCRDTFALSCDSNGLTTQCVGDVDPAFYGLPCPNPAPSP